MSKRERRRTPPVTKAQRPTVQEIGVTGLDIAGGRVHDEFLRQMSGPLGQRTYREMSRNDPVVRAVLWALESLIRPVTWRVEGDEGDPRTAYLGTVLSDMSHSWGAFISEWMAAPIYGFAAFEIVWKLRRGSSAPRPGEQSRYDDGLWGVRKLAPRHPTTLDRWEMDAQGGVQAMVQRAPPDYQPRRIPIERLLLFTVGGQKGSPEGVSLLRGAYVPWYRKKHIEEIEAIGIERELAGLPVFYAPAEWFAANDSRLDDLKRIGKRLRTDDQACLILPTIRDPDGQDLLRFELTTTGGRRAIDTGPAKEYYARQIAMTLLADVILLGHERVGSLALASSKTALFSAGIGALLDGIEDVMNRHLAPRLMEANGWSQDGMPQWRHGDIETVDLAALGQYVSQLAAAGMDMFPTDDGELENELLAAANLRAEYRPRRGAFDGEGEDDDGAAVQDGNDTGSDGDDEAIRL